MPAQESSEHRSYDTKLSPSPSDLPLPSAKECNYRIHAIQRSSRLTKFIANIISIYVSIQRSSRLTKFIANIISIYVLNKFIIKICSISNLIVLILYHKYLDFLYRFSQNLNCLISRRARIAFIRGR
jgi:hypothetical protein